MEKFLKLVLTSLILFSNFSLTSAQNSCEIQKWEWAKNVASEPYQLSLKSAYDSENRLYVAGYFENFLDLGDTTLSSEGYTSYLAKYSSEGIFLWAKIIEKNARVIELKVANEKLFLLTAYRSHPEKELWTLSQHNLEGDQLWAYSPEEFEKGFLLNLFVDREGYSYVGGSFNDTIQLENEVKIAESILGDGFVAKFSGEGGFQWIAQIPHFTVAGIAVNSIGEVYTTGSTFESFHFAGDLINLYENASSGGFFLKFSTVGEAISYEYVAKAPVFSSLAAIAIDKDDNVIVGGNFESTYTSPEDTATTIIGTNRYRLNYSFIAKYNEDNDFLWSDTLTAGGQISVVDIEVNDSTNEYYLAENKLTEHLLLNYGANGSKNWELMVTEIIGTYGAAFTIDLNPGKTEITVAGNYNQATQFGSTSIIPLDPGNAYLAQLQLNAKIDPPAQPSSSIQATNQTATSVDLSWENGDGTGRLVLLKKLGKVNPLHIEDGIEYADGSGEFGTGTQTGEREYVVYVGEGSEATVTGLQPGRPYQVAVIEYNDSLSCPDLTNYLQESVAKKAFLTPGGLKFSAYPNPFTREILTVQLPENTSGEAVLSLRDAYGRKIVQRQVKKLAQEGNEVRVDIAALNLPIGIYYLHMTGQPAIRLVKK